MKTIKLNDLGNRNLSNREMKEVMGGVCCQCSCAYANNGGSSTNDNGNANAAGCLVSKDEPVIDLPEVPIYPE